MDRLRRGGKRVEKVVKKIIARIARPKQGRGVRHRGEGYPGRGPAYVARDAKRGSAFPRNLIDRLVRRKRNRHEKQPPAPTQREGGGWGRRLALGLCILVAAVALYQGRGLLRSGLEKVNLFQVREIQVSGCRVTKSEMIREAGGLKYKANLLALDLRTVQRLIEALPWIKEASVVRRWPDVVMVRVTEHVPEALLVRQSGGKGLIHYLDGEGVEFSEAGPGLDLDYPIITGLEGVADEGERQRLLADPLAFLKLAKRNDPNLPAQNISEIHVDGKAGMVVYLVDYPFPIYFGQGEVRKKYSRLRRVLEALYRENKEGQEISRVAYIRMDYLENKVLVAQNGSDKDNG